MEQESPLVDIFNSYSPSRLRPMTADEKRRQQEKLERSTELVSFPIVQQFDTTVLMERVAKYMDLINIFVVNFEQIEPIGVLNSTYGNLGV